MKLFRSIFRKIRVPISKVRSRYLFNKRRDNFQLKSHKVFNDFCIALREANIDFFLVFGTLLGAIRENGIISHDIDIDVGVKSDVDFVIMDYALIRHGFVKTRQIDLYSKKYCNKGFEVTYSKESVSIDIFIFHPCNDNNRYYTHVFYDRVVNEHFILYRNVFRIEFPLEGLSKITFIDNIVSIPSNFDAFLSAHYGPDYMIPNPYWRLTDSYSGKTISDCLGFIELKK